MSSLAGSSSPGSTVQELEARIKLIEACAAEASDQACIAADKAMNAASLAVDMSLYCRMIEDSNIAAEARVAHADNEFAILRSQLTAVAEQLEAEKSVNFILSTSMQESDGLMRTKEAEITTLKAALDAAKRKAARELQSPSTDTENLRSRVLELEKLNEEQQGEVEALAADLTLVFEALMSKEKALGVAAAAQAKAEAQARTLNDASCEISMYEAKLASLTQQLVEAQRAAMSAASEKPVGSETFSVDLECAAELVNELGAVKTELEERSRECETLRMKAEHAEKRAVEAEARLGTKATEVSCLEQENLGLARKTEELTLQLARALDELSALKKNDAKRTFSSSNSSRLQPQVQGKENPSSTKQTSYRALLEDHTTPQQPSYLTLLKADQRASRRSSTSLPRGEFSGVATYLGRGRAPMVSA